MSDQNQDQLEEQVEDQQEEQEIEYDYQEVTEDHENLFRELTDSSNESLADPEPEPEPEEEEEPEPQETASQQDQAKANVAVEQIGNKSYIDQDLINSIEDKELRQKVWNLANTAQSHYNRVYAKEQEVNKLRNEIAHLQAEQQLAARKTSTATEKKAVDEDTQRKISRLKEDYPDLSDSIEAMFQTRINEHSDQLRELFDKEYSPIREKMAQESRQGEISRLEQAANDIFRTDQTGVNYRDVVASPDFQTWLEQQDQSIKQLASSERAAEVINVLKNYEYDYSRQFERVNGQSWVEFVTSQREQAKKPQSSTNTPNNPASTAKGDQIKQQREKRLKTAVTGVKPSRHASNSGASLDSDSLFNHFAKQSRYNSR
jgi:hypothetical protein